MSLKKKNIQVYLKLIAGNLSTEIILRRFAVEYAETFQENVRKGLVFFFSSCFEFMHVYIFWPCLVRRLTTSGAAFGEKKMDWMNN